VWEEGREAIKHTLTALPLPQTASSIQPPSLSFSFFLGRAYLHHIRSPLHLHRYTTRTLLSTTLARWRHSGARHRVPVRHSRHACYAGTLTAHFSACSLTIYHHICLLLGRAMRTLLSLAAATPSSTSRQTYNSLAHERASARGRLRTESVAQRQRLTRRSTCKLAPDGLYAAPSARRRARISSASCAESWYGMSGARALGATSRRHEYFIIETRGRKPYGTALAAHGACVRRAHTRCCAATLACRAHGASSPHP